MGSPPFAGSPIEWVVPQLSALNNGISLYFRGFFRNRNLCVFKLGIVHQNHLFWIMTDSMEFGAFGVEYILDNLNAFCGLVGRFVSFFILLLCSV